MHNTNEDNLQDMLTRFVLNDSLYHICKEKCETFSRFRTVFSDKFIVCLLSSREIRRYKFSMACFLYLASNAFRCACS